MRAIIRLLGVSGSGGYDIYRKLQSLSNDGRGETSALRVPQGKSSDALGKVPTIKRDGVENKKINQYSLSARAYESLCCHEDGGIV